MLEAPAAVEALEVADDADDDESLEVVAATVAAGVELAATVPPMGAVDWPLI